MPKIVIGVPVYNGFTLIRECLQNLAAQTLCDFSVIISDNASNDGTSDICSDFCKQDQRFKHILQPTTVPANDNFNFLLSLVNSEYFAFRAYDDLSSEDWLQTLFDLLEQSPSSRLAVGNIVQTFAPPKKERFFKYPSNLCSGYFNPTIHIVAQMFLGHASWFYGLWRTKDLKDSYSRVMKMYTDPWGSDHLIVLDAILNEGVVGTSRGANFIQRILPTPRYYVKKNRPEFIEMTIRNRRFLDSAKRILQESPSSLSESALLTHMMKYYTLHRCHGPRRLAQARLKAILKTLRY